MDKIGDSNSKEDLSFLQLQKGEVTDSVLQQIETTFLQHWSLPELQSFICNNERKKKENEKKMEKATEKEDLAKRICAPLNTQRETNFIFQKYEMEPNTYQPKLFVLLEQERMRHYYIRKNNIFSTPPYWNQKPFHRETVVPELKNTVTKKKIYIEVNIETLEDLIALVEKYPCSEELEYNINMDSLHKIHPYLIRLQNMIGMKMMKKNILDQILYFIQDLHVGGKGSTRGDYLHTVIYGPPGSGKTQVAKIIGKIFSKLGILKKGTFKKVTRSDLVAGYLGQTAIKTRDVIQEALDGVLFIDEAYALGNTEKRDSFSKECIDTLCEALSNHKENLMVIIAGYEKELNECFFPYNKGLDSRFTWRFKIENYDGADLHKIFLKKITDFGWKTDNSLKEAWFVKNMPYFTFFGRDMEVLFSKTKIAHGRRIFGKSTEKKRVITIKDLEKGMDMFLENEEVKNRKQMDTYKYMMNTMYV